MKNGLCYFSQGQWCYKGWCANGKIVFLHCAHISKSKVQQQPAAWYHFLIMPYKPLVPTHPQAGAVHHPWCLITATQEAASDGAMPKRMRPRDSRRLGLPSTKKMLEVDRLQQVFHTHFPWRLQMNSAWANLPWFNIPAPQTAKLWLYKYLEKMFHVSSQHLSLVTSVWPESVHCQWICPPPPWSWQSPQHPVAAQSHCLLPPCTKKLFNS